MKPKDKLTRKKNKKPAPIIKFIFIFILISAVGFFIFYSVDNPIFLKEIRNKFFSNNNSSKSEEIISNSLWQRVEDFLKKLKREDKDKNILPGKITINFYFCSLGEDSKLVAEKRTIAAGDLETAVSNAMQELLKGPAKSYHFPVIPGGTKLLGVEIYKNVAKIDLSGEFLENSLDTRILDEYIIYSIVNTLTEIPDIEGVIFYIEGKRVKIYGNIDLSIPAIRNEKYIEE